MTECHYPPLSHSPRAGPELFSHWLVFLYREKPHCKYLGTVFSAYFLGKPIRVWDYQVKGYELFHGLIRHQTYGLAFITPSTFRKLL